MKLAVIKKESQSSWRSCQSITSNLERAYQSIGECHSMTLSEREDPIEFRALAEKILEDRYTHLVWVDHYPHPGPFLNFFAKNYREELKECPLFVLIHLFGDFILHSPQWAQFFSQWDNKSLRIQLVAASHKQAKLVKQFLSREDCEVIPFPVDEKQFFFEEGLRQEKRAELGLREEENLFFYSGRLSYQKNILDMIHGFSHYLKMTNSASYLFIAGPMDDLGIPYIGKEALDGTFYFHWEECMRELPKEVRKRITYLGNIDGTRLRSFYCAADLYISMSCHNDEDYGMAPAEALLCGLPCLLSAWGGFSSFHSFLPDGVSLVPVSLSQRRQAPKVLDIAKRMLLTKKCTEREGLSQEAQRYLSIGNVAQFIERAILNSSYEFSGFNRSFEKLSGLFQKEGRGPFREPSGGYSLFYREVYKSYCGKVEER